MQPSDSVPNEISNEEARTRFMSLGSPRSIIQPEEPRPSLHFTMIPERMFRPHTKLQYFGWIAVALVLGISLSAFVTEAFLVTKDLIFNKPTNAVSMNTYGANSVYASSTDQEGKGSDDSLASSTAGLINPLDQYTLANIDKFPKLNAESYLIGDIDTGEIIYEHNETQIAPIASVSKLMTGLIAYQEMNPDQVAVVSSDAYNTFGTEGELLLGEKIRIKDLMYPLLIESSNDGADVIADAYAGGHDAFVLEMNKKAKQLGMTNTNYEEPSGLSAKNVSSVEDLFRLGRYIWQNAPDIWDITRVRQYSIYQHQWTNQNALLQRSYFLGGKNGFIDESKQTTVSLFQVPMANGINRNIAIVLLRSADRTTDALNIINFLKKDAYFNVGTGNATSTAQ